MTVRTDWRELIAQVPRDPFIPETIWVDIDAAHSQSGFTALSKHDHPQRWRELVAANEPVITQVGFSIGVQVPRCALTVELNKFGEDHHVLELDDITTQSWARLDAHLTSPNPLVVHQLGPRRLWDEAVAAYDWWYEHDKPDLTRFGMTMTTDTQTVWLDDPSTVVRTFHLHRPQVFS